MVSYGALKLGRMSALLVFMASGGVAEVHAHQMHPPVAHHGSIVAPSHATCSTLTSGSPDLAGHMMVEHHRAHDPRDRGP